MEFSPCGGVVMGCLEEIGPSSSTYKSIRCMQHWVLEANLKELCVGLVEMPGTWPYDCLAWHPTLRRPCLYAKVNEGSIHLIDALQHRIVQTWTASCLGPIFGTVDQLTDLQWSPDGTRLYVTGMGKIACLLFA